MKLSDFLLYRNKQKCLYTPTMFSPTFLNMLLYPEKKCQITEVKGMQSASHSDSKTLISKSKKKRRKKLHKSNEKY